MPHLSRHWRWLAAQFPLSATSKSAHLSQKELRRSHHSLHTGLRNGSHSWRTNPDRNSAVWQNKAGLHSPRPLDSIALVIPLDLPNPRVPIPKRRSVAMRIQPCELALIALSTSAPLWMSPASARFSNDIAFYRFAYRASRVPIHVEMEKSSWEDFR
jgi:hypothetical protein